MKRRTFLRIGGLGGATLLAGCGSGGGDTTNPATDGASGGTETSETTAGGTGLGSETTTSTSVSDETTVGGEPNVGGETGTGDGAMTDEDGTSTGTETGPANFSNVSVSGPSNVTVGEDFALPVSVSNVGGENGTYQSYLTIAEGSSNLNQSVEIAGIEPGASGQSEVGSLNFTTADTYTFTVKGANTTHTVTVDPITKSLGESFTLDNGLAVTVQEVALQQAMFYTAEVRSGVLSEPRTVTRLLPAPSDSVLVVLRLALENTGTGAVTFGTDSIQVPQGSLYSEFESGIGLDAAKEIDATPLTGVNVDAAQQTQGWMLAQIPRSVATGEFGVRYQRDSSDTPPEVRWAVPPQGSSARSLPQFSLQSFEMPETAEVGRDKPISITIANDGNGAGRFRGIVQFRVSESEDWQSGGITLTGDIQAGATKTFTPPINYPYTNILDFRVQSYDSARTIEFVPATQSFGNSYTTPSGVTVTVSNIQQSDTYQTEDGSDPETSTDNNHFILAQIETEVVEQEVSEVTADQFVLADGSETYSDVNYYTSTTITSPVEGSYFFNSTDEQGEVFAGWLIFSVPQEYTADGAVVRWSNSDGAVSEWRAGAGPGGTSTPSNGSSNTTANNSNTTTNN